MLQSILKEYALDGVNVIAKPFGSGLINHTWIVTNGNDKFILQKINDRVFKKPSLIAENIRVIGDYLSQHSPEYLFVDMIKTISGEDLLYIPSEGYFRMFRFVNDSHSADIVTTAHLAFEAAKQFGKFTRLLCGFESFRLKTTLPDFHNLSLRYLHFEKAVSEGNRARVAHSQSLIKSLKNQKYIATGYERICTDSQFKKRVTHHDTKISNVLFDSHSMGLCVIDLDTVMPGYFISDVGDMIRTYICPVNEEENDLKKIHIRPDYFEAIATGYLGEMSEELTTSEKNNFVYAGKFMIYMQALRFLTDHLNDDIYYGAKYKDHNYFRAANQCTLLQKLIEKEPLLLGRLSAPGGLIHH